MIGTPHQSDDPLPVRRIDAEQFQQLVEGATPERVHRFDLVAARLPDGRIAKVFRTYPPWSSRWWWPASDRFERGVRELARRDVATVGLLERFRLVRPRRDIITYTPIEGAIMREALDRDGESDMLWHRFATFLAELHDKGVYFRGLHFGNVIVMPDDRLGLIDVADSRFFRRSLRTSLRIRNFRHFAMHPLDAPRVGRYGLERILESYLASSALDGRGRRAVQDRVAGMNRGTAR
ncbi:MAG: hypothetical protein CMJ18_27640 [Phycisphaeraceae bacterium]|nr:hypothetical protein [Phycisphaeraceae bacterium]